MRKEFEKGTSPESAEMKVLSKRWQELTSMFTGGDPEITRAAEQYYKQNPDRAMQVGIDKELWEYNPIT